ncbi:hypothetical protein TNCV_1269881 [Trichonephila clavipes]|nr:hypothetical protein TNCV_1269881 [Trichonephila clavipes]
MVLPLLRAILLNEGVFIKVTLYKAIQGLLVTDFVNLDHRRGTWTTPELSQPLSELHHHTHGKNYELDRSNVYQTLYTVGLQWHDARTLDTPAMSMRSVPLDTMADYFAKY